MLMFLFVVVIVSLIGGFWPALAAAVAASLLLNYYFIPPIHQFTISDPQNVLALVVFVVDRRTRVTGGRSGGPPNQRSGPLQRRSRDPLDSGREPAARRARAARAAWSGCGKPSPSRASPCCGGKAMRPQAAKLVRRHRPREACAERGRWWPAPVINPCGNPDEGDAEVPVGDDLILVLRGRQLAAEDQRLLAAFATEVAVAYQQRRLADAADTASKLAESDRTRTALLNAVSHDLRTPIASAKAAVSSLLAGDVQWSEQDRRELLVTANSALDRLTALVTNLLDLSRLQSEALSIACGPVGLDDVVGNALAMITGGDQVSLEVPPRPARGDRRPWTARTSHRQHRGERDALHAGG